MNAWLKRGLLALAGGAVGFAYYYFIGCTSGACPITSNPYISTAYGALIGGVIGMGAEKKKPTE
jgi:outer membrane lipoprotein SlyB